MNGVRSTFMRRGYLLTALSALLLLAASSGTAEAQSIGFVDSSGSVSETASLEPGAFEGPLEVTIRASGLDRRDQPNLGLGTLMLTTSHAVSIQKLAPTGAVATQAHADATAVGASGTDLADSVDLNLTGADFGATGEVVLLVKQHNGTGGEVANGIKDSNWLNENIKLTLGAGPGVSVSPNVYTVMVEDNDVAPLAKFDVPSFTLTEGSQRGVKLDIVEGRRGATIPTAISGRNQVVTVQVSNHQMVGLGGVCGRLPTDANYGKAVVIVMADDQWEGVTGGSAAAADSVFRRTGQLMTATSVADLADSTAAGTTADMTIHACARSDFRDEQVTLTILSNGLREQVPSTGNVTVGDPLMITLASDESAPTLSFTTTDVTIDEGGEARTVLIAEGMHATDVGQVKLMVEGDAMVDLYHEDTMLEEMNGYVMVDFGSSNSVRLMAKSHESRELEDGQMAYKMWNLVDGSTDVNVSDDSSFRVDIRGLTAVPALPLIGQLLLALFLMAGGSRLYRRRRD